MTIEFSLRTRQKNLERFDTETFDLLIIGGGITGAACARDAASRGMAVALVDKHDFAWGTSSRSSKLIHGGLRYLENFEFGLVFEALRERTHLLQTSPHRVEPLPFYMPLYQSAAKGRGLIGMGLWLYDLLSLFRSPGRHRHLSPKKFLEAIPFIKTTGLQGGFLYHDARMWDDLLTLDTLRSAQAMGAAVVNYTEAVGPVWEGDSITGYELVDRESGRRGRILARQVVLCAGPWTDEMGSKLSPTWKNCLTPSQGIHLVFDLQKFPLPGAMVMSHPEDGRLAFLIPRPDYGEGVVLVGTTDVPSPHGPERAEVTAEEVDYLMGLLRLYFPTIKIGLEDIITAYVGVRPLVSRGGAGSLQKVSREHHIEEGPGGIIFVAGGKFTTHRTMAMDILDTVQKIRPDLPQGRPQTDAAACVSVLDETINEAKREALAEGLEVPTPLVHRYGADFHEIVAAGRPTVGEDPAGFPHIEEQLRYLMRHEMVLHLEDMFLRRLPLMIARRDHGLPWAKRLARVWAHERNQSAVAAEEEVRRLETEIARRSAWRKKIVGNHRPKENKIVSIS